MVQIAIKYFLVRIKYVCFLLQNFAKQNIMSKITTLLHNLHSTIYIPTSSSKCLFPNEIISRQNCQIVHQICAYFNILWMKQLISWKKWLLTYRKWKTATSATKIIKETNASKGSGKNKTASEKFRDNKKKD